MCANAVHATSRRNVVRLITRVLEKRMRSRQDANTSVIGVDNLITGLRINMMFSNAQTGDRLKTGVI
jgi:hypothetical protein